MKSFKYVFVLSGLLVFVACNNSSSSNNGDDANANNVIEAPATLTYQIIKTHTHDTTSYTE